MAKESEKETGAKLVAETPAENVKVVVPTSAKVPTSMQAEGPSPSHPSLKEPDPVTGDPDIDEAKARASMTDDEFAREDELNDGAPVNVGKPVGKPIKTIVRRKFYSEEGRIEVPGKLFYFQLREGQHFPSDVLEPVDKNLAAKYRKEFRKRRDARIQRRMELQRRREALLLAAGDAE